MITFILPGFSPSNKSWIEGVAKNITVDGEIRPVYWEHWTDVKRTLNPKRKAQDVIDVALNEQINIIAKSVGTLVAAYIAQLAPDRINKIILCGIPSVSDKRLEICKEAFGKIQPDKVVIIQNTEDPFASYGEVKAFMKKVNPRFRIIEKPLHTHDYPYFDDFQKFLI